VASPEELVQKYVRHQNVTLDEALNLLYSTTQEKDQVQSNMKQGLEVEAKSISMFAFSKSPPLAKDEIMKFRI